MLAATTLLEAVNICLAAIGADPINQLDEQNDVDCANALSTINKVSRKVQLRGWDFNSFKLRLVPDAPDKNIMFDNNYLEWTPPCGRSIIRRGDKFYDNDKATFEFDTPLEMLVVQAVAFEELPQPIREYVSAKAAYDFQAVFMGDSAISQDLTIALAEAGQAVVDYEISHMTINKLESPSVSPMLYRW